MVTRCAVTRLLRPAVLLAMLVLVSCEKVPLLAPTGSTIIVTAGTSVLSANGTTTIIAQVLEQAGTPPHSGTQVTFTTTLGRIEPAQASTDVNGRATATFAANGSNGTATISALSGGATTGTDGAITIAIGSAAVGNVSVTASPNPVSASSGATTVTAYVQDINGNVLVGVPVVFTTTAGSLAAGLVQTDANGRAATSLVTTQQATVTATVGAQSSSGGSETPSPSGQRTGSVTVNVSAAPTITITSPDTVTEGLPASFTITVTAATTSGSAIRDVVVNWGDGSTQNLGGFVGAQRQFHVYGSDGPYLVSATVTDVLGNISSVSASIVVMPLASPSISITPAPTTAAVGASITFTIAITPPAGVLVRSASIDYGDNSSDQLGGATSTTRSHVYASAGVKSVEVTVEDTAGQTSTGSISVTITP